MGGVTLFSAVEIEINHSCNRQCSYCPNSILERKTKGEIDLVVFEKVMVELHEIGFQGRISYSFYNEPLLHSDFDGIVRKTRSYLPGSVIEVYTNGTLLSKERFFNLLSFGVSHFVVTRHEGEKTFEFEKVYRDLSDQDKKFVCYRKFSEIELTNRGGLMKNLGSKGLVLAPCFIPSFIVTITVSGNVIPCFEDFNENLVMGNVKEQRLMDIWNTGKYVSFRQRLKIGQRHLYVPCRDCNRRQVLPPNDA